MNNSPRVEASLTTRVRVWSQGIPLVTKLVFYVCTTLSAGAFLAGTDLAHPACLSAQLVVEKLQLHRLATAAFVHSGILHLAFNMFAFVPLGSSLERQQGSIQFAYYVLLYMLLGDTFFIVCAYAADWYVYKAFGIGHSGCAVGLSGIIFAFVVVDTHLSGAPQRSIFGFFNVPAAYFPWALLVLWQLLLPHVSFFGHLGGILAGQSFVWGWLHPLVPSSATLQAVERCFPIRLCVQHASFMSHTGNAPAPVAAHQAGPFGADMQERLASLRGSLSAWVPALHNRLASSSSREHLSDPEIGKPERRAHFLGGSSEMPSAPRDAAATAAESRAQRASFPGQLWTSQAGSTGHSDPQSFSQGAGTKANQDSKISRVEQQDPG